MVWAVSEFTKARVLSDVGGYIKVGVAFLELGLNQSGADAGNGEEESIVVVVHLLRDTHEETVKQGGTGLSGTMVLFISRKY